MRGVGVQGRQQPRPFQNQADPRVAPTVNPPTVTLGQAKPTLQIEMIPDRFILRFAHEQAGQEAEHHRRHPVADRIFGRLEFETVQSRKSSDSRGGSPMLKTTRKRSTFVPTLSDPVSSRE